MKDSKVRFSDRVEDYKRYRPSYPPEALQFVKDNCKVEKEWRIADIGSGTGISTGAVLNAFGCHVFAVEPNENMRLEAEASFSKNPLFHSINGSSEETRLEANSINVIAAFQAFHWFDKTKSRIEFKRISAEPNWVVLVWNDRISEGTAFLEGYEAILQLLPEYPKVNHRNSERCNIERFIGATDLVYAEFENSQQFDFEGLKGRFFSSSYTPSFGTQEHQIQIDKLNALFEDTNKNGTIEFVYKTQIYLGKLR